MKKSFFLIRVLSIIAFLILGITSCDVIINTNQDPHFDDEGTLIKDSTEVPFQLLQPNKIKFFVEVSGSMNGFFRKDQATKFKEDVWRIISYYSPLADNVTILTNDGAVGKSMHSEEYRKSMNTDAFVPGGSTNVLLMLKSILENIKTEDGEVAVLISDMKYSPVGMAAPEVLLTQYSTDISRLFGEYGKAISLVGASSEYLDKQNKIICGESPYYFLILGNQEHVAYMRNGISTLLENNNDLIGNIESGFNYGTPSYSFGISDNCFQKESEPTFTGYDPSYSDTCTINLRVDLANYRWATTRKDLFPQTFKYKAIYGSEVSVSDIKYVVKNITAKTIERTAYAEVELKICNMATESEVIEWTLELPDLDIAEFAPFLGATTERDVSKSYSLEYFIQGMFYGGVVNQSLKKNYILISKNS